ncbi:MAG: LysR family transcriptional regulator [Alphaproteobacteria bacterium]|nr:LysR family transcriptional regulator [Alphaproteobacteria bacterium]
MDWDKLRVFLSVAEAGSFTHAGEGLSLSQSAVSRQISALEDSLTVPLFHRHARGLILTEQGELLFRTAKEIFAKLAMTEAMLNESKDRPKGPLRVTTTVAFGSTWLTPRMTEFFDLYPEIRLTLLVDDDELDLSMREADVAIRMTLPRQGDLIQRHLATFHFHLYAAPAYLRRQGVPRRIDDLQDHRLITYGSTTHPPFPDVNWIMRAGGNDFAHRTALEVNNFFAIFKAVQTGVGIAALPDYMAREDSTLVRLLPEIEAPAVPAYFVYPEELRNSKRIAVLRDFLLRKVANQNF